MCQECIKILLKYKLMSDNECDMNPGRISGIALDANTSAIEQAAELLGRELDVMFGGLRAVATDPTQTTTARRAAIACEDELLVRVDGEVAALEKTL